MKYLFGIAFCIMAVACSSEGGEEAAETDGAAVETPAADTDNLPDFQAIPAGASAHYICSNACAGGEGAQAGPCPVCGTEMTHNQGFHDQQAAPAGGAQEAPISIGGEDGGEVSFEKVDGPPPTQGGQAAEPAQNAAGVWHYTCSAGCAGGAGSAGKCATCGGELAHNQGYH